MCIDFECKKVNTRTNIVLDDELIAKAMVRAGVTTKKAAVEAALKAFVRKPDYSGLLALRGAGMLADDYDPDEACKIHPIEPLMVAQDRAPYVVTALVGGAKSSGKQISVKRGLPKKR